MNKNIHKLLCWLLFIVLSGQPMFVFASALVSSLSQDNCHEMNIEEHHQVNSKKSIANDVNTVKDDCCEDCDSCSACVGMSSCGRHINAISFFVYSNDLLSRSEFLSQGLIEKTSLYLNQIISPDIRPPLV